MLVMRLPSALSSLKFRRQCSSRGVCPLVSHLSTRFSVLTCQGIDVVVSDVKTFDILQVTKRSDTCQSSERYDVSRINVNKRASLQVVSHSEHSHTLGDAAQRRQLVVTSTLKWSAAVAFASDTPSVTTYNVSKSSFGRNSFR
jgi:hypothetical protein